MKSVLISIKPKWCELIASGKKTVEVRKTKPKLETPFKVYIYCTKDKWQHLVQMPDKSYRIYNGKEYGKYDKSLIFDGEANETVIGEFVCDGIIPISIEYSNPDSRIALKEFPYTCLTDKQIIDYLGNGNQGYGWHISNLLIYDKPKALSEFRSYNTRAYFDEKIGLPMPTHEITRPFQSWGYVYETDT